MDRKDADIKMACNSIEKHLQVPPLLLQLPVRENRKLVGKSLGFIDSQHIFKGLLTCCVVILNITIRDSYINKS